MHRTNLKITYLPRMHEAGVSASAVSADGFWNTVSHVAGQSCELCAQYGIRLASTIRKSTVFVNGNAGRRVTVQSICIHHSLHGRAQRFLHATGYALLGRDQVMVQTTFRNGTLAWEPVVAG